VSQIGPENWKRVKRLHAEALDLVPDERPAFLDAECGGDDEVRAEVERLLEASIEEGFMRPSATHFSGEEREAAGLIGTVLGDFVLLSVIGRGGGGGAVYLARQVSLDRTVAVKVLPGHATLFPRRLERFRREALAIARLPHPGIVPIYTVGEEDGIHYFAMEYVPAPDLHLEIKILQRKADGEAAEDGRLPAPDAPEACRRLASLTAEVADALQVAHDNGIVHRDVKPQNILLSREGRPRLIDFGLARDEGLGSITQTDVIQGTPDYMSPEQARVSVEDVDHRTDVYSLGVVLYELLTLHRPFKGRTSREILYNIKAHEARPVRRFNSRVPIDLATICGKAMEKECGRRYDSAAELAADLRRFIAGEPIKARPPTLVYRARRFVTRRRTEVIGVAATLVALLIGVGGMQYVQRVQAEARRPHITVRTVPESFNVGGNAVTPRVWARPIDPFDPAPGERIELGATPLVDVALDPGYWRIVVEVEGYGFAECTRDLSAGEPPVEVIAYVRSTNDVVAKMVSQAGGVFDFPQEAAHAGRCIHANTPLSVPGFQIDPLETTVGEYRAYLADTGQAPPSFWDEWDLTRLADDMPAAGLTWRQSQAYAEWAGKRLATHAEWELAARGFEGREWPNGSEVAGNVFGEDDFMRGSGAADFEIFLAGAHPVGSHPEAATPAGLHDLHGNVSEWTESMLRVFSGGEEEINHDVRYVMGGAWDAIDDGRVGLPESHGFNYIFDEYAQSDRGFRCAKSVTP
jgi:formylglycine-generating enzyme required for sulfatase activity